MESEFRHLAKALMAGVAPDAEKLAYRRGYWAGVKFVLDTPEKITSRAEREVERTDLLERDSV